MMKELRCGRGVHKGVFYTPNYWRVCPACHDKRNSVEGLDPRCTDRPRRYHDEDDAKISLALMEYPNQHLNIGSDTLQKWEGPPRPSEEGWTSNHDGWRRRKSINNVDEPL